MLSHSIESIVGPIPSGTEYLTYESYLEPNPYLEAFPDYMTQGVSLEELQENFRDIYDDLTAGKIPGVRHVAELTIA